MKRAFVWLIAGFVIFVTVYSLVFPDSQLPMRAKTEFLALTPMVDGIMLDDFIVADDTVYHIRDGAPVEIGLPERPTLPASLEWEQPVSSISQVTNGTAIFSFRSGKQQMWDGAWSEVSAANLADTQVTQGDIVLFDDCRFERNPKIYLSENRVFLDYDNKTFAGNLDVGEVVWEEIDDSTGLNKDDMVEIGDYRFEIKDDGRIVRYRDDLITAVSDRTSLSPLAVPYELATDGKNLFALLSSTSSGFSPDHWIQILDKSLVFKSQIVKARNGIIPVSVDVWKGDTLLVLWGDGTLSAYTLWGQEIAKFSVCKNPMDMVVWGDRLLVLTGSSLFDVVLTLREPNVVVWPRVADIGRVAESGSEFNIHVVSDEIPSFRIKGDGVTLETIQGEEGGYTATFKITIDSLDAFVTLNGEIIIETGLGHEIVPYSFTPYGEVRKLRRFAQGLLDEETGEFFDYIINDTGLSIPALERKKSSTNSIFWDELSDSVFVLTPSPGLPFDLLTRDIEGP
ncbi:MAG TPA: hypothetical protein PKV16_08730 [Caldisericia bacterium]|mgnify:CR=1 FL=1|nr:hypothetical protein [Caldisericia bacterium]HPF49602.1 hypothetical protein [Caldisericia bacterium]HPI84482.1 hypothetical protein [Caldisericia bacterium]HPQ93848.1 hypothetical protein [Caldisericia bacterium]HRV75393.1 hypothetical protein [Caldisericia bacterium]